ncbi:MAG: hypothetical protein ACFFD2_22700 [Promethearchaeota archaeon]
MIIYIQKSYGRFEIELINTNVNLIPNKCLKCDLKCKNWRQPVCIQPVYGAFHGWSNIGLSQSDLLILSKAIALKYDLIDNNIKNQINTILTTLQPQNIPDIPEHPDNSTISERHMLEQELRNLFRNHRRNYCIR